ncbi:MAG: HPP family protein [Alphaproteobacteria bacterium]|nr:HPP family protein [Alphaproteobacteria bacterium]
MDNANTRRMRLGRALYVGFVALVITGIVGTLGLAFQQPWLFPSLGPTIFIHTVTPRQEAARPWNTFAGHAIGAAAAFLALAVFGALHAPSAMILGQVGWQRIAASALAVALTIGGQIPLRAGHAPAAATTLLITLGGLKPDLATIGVLIIGIILATFLCDWGRRLVDRELGQPR